MKRLHLFLVALFAILVLSSATAPAAAPPAAPEYVNVSWLDNSDQFLVRWFPVAEATSYNVYRYDTNTSAWTTVATNLSFNPWNVLSFRESGSQDSGLTTYSVTAVNGDGESASTSASVTPGHGLSIFTCYFDYWPHGYTFLQSECQGSWLAGSMGMLELSTDGTNFTHGVWSTNIQISQIHRITNLVTSTNYTRYYTRLTYIDTNGSGFSEVYPWDGVYTLPLTNINVWEDMDNEVHIGDYTWYVPAQILTPPAHGTLVPGSFAHQWFYRPDTNFTGIDTFEIFDNPSGPPLTITLNVQNVNEPPISEPFTVYVPKNASSVITPPVHDFENDPYMVYIGDYPTNGYVDRYNDTNYIYTPLEGFTGTDHFTYMAHDTYAWNGIYVMATVIVTNANTRPVTDNQSFTATEDTPLTFTVQGSDYDNDPLSIEIVDPPLNGSITSVGLTATYTPGPNHCCDDYMSFRVSDGQASSVLYWIFIYILPVNDSPVADNKSLTTLEDQSVSVTFSGSDVEGSTLTFAVVTPPQHGTFIDGVYTPATNYFGPDSFTYKANDGQADSAPATVNITVVSADDGLPSPEFVKLAWVNADHFLIRWAPVPTATGYNVYRFDTNISALVQIATNLQVLSVPLFRDPSPAVPATYVVRALNSEGEGAAGTASLTPDPSALAPYISVIPETWRIGRSYVQPRFTQSLIAGTDGMAEIRIQGSNEFFAVCWVTNANQMQILEFTNLAPWVPYEVQFTAVTDYGIGTSAAPPQSWFYLEPPSATLQEDTSVTIDLGTQTAEVLQVLTQPSHGTLTPLQDGRYTTYTPAPNFFGTDTFQILDHTSGPPVTVTVTVQNVNDAPEAQPITVYVAEDSVATFPPVVFDIENDPYVFTVTIPPAHGDAFGYQFTHLMYIPYPDFVGEDEFWYYALDESEGPYARVTVIVTNVNDAPIAENHFFTASEDTPLTFTLSASDVDGDTLTVEFGTAPAHGAITNNGLSVTYAPNLNYYGTDGFTYRVSDGQVASDWKTVDLLINPVNDAPTADNKSASTSEDQSVVIALTGSDIDGDSLLFVVVTPPQHGEFTGDTYIPAANYYGPDSFTYKANDGQIDSALATVSITVNAVNDAPAANDQSVSTAYNTGVNIVLTGGDVEGSALTFTTLTSPANGTLSGTGANRTFTPNIGWYGATAFTFKVNDGAVDSATATVTITVAAPSGIPAAPTSLTATAVSQNQINLAWTDNSSNEDGFKIERATAATGPWTEIATVGPGVTAYASTGLTKNKRYYYRVRAYNILGNSAYSNIANDRTLN